MQPPFQRIVTGIATFLLTVILVVRDECQHRLAALMTPDDCRY
ncbi:MAG: hypothetical protein AAF827_21200 [Cyanobacteria bacterium P01_D01_bin.6]